MRLGAGPVEIGMGLGWFTSAVLAMEAFERGGLKGLVITGLFGWGTIAAGIKLQALGDERDRYEKALRKHGIDPSREY